MLASALLTPMKFKIHVRWQGQHKEHEEVSDKFCAPTQLQPAEQVVHPARAHSLDCC